LSNTSTQWRSLKKSLAGQANRKHKKIVLNRTTLLDISHYSDLFVPMAVAIFEIEETNSVKIPPCYRNANQELGEEMKVHGHAN
jgi:hypothetical protein